MDKGIVFVKTRKGEDEIRNETSLVYGDVKRILMLVDNKSTAKELKKRAPPSLRDSLDEVLQELLSGGFIQDQKIVGNTPVAASPRISIPKLIKGLGAGMGMQGTIGDIGHAAGPLLAGILIAHLNYANAFAIIAGLQLVAAAVFWMAMRRT